MPGEFEQAGRHGGISLARAGNQRRMPVSRFGAAGALCEECGRPGIVAIRVALRARIGHAEALTGERIGHATNNVAEYKALLRGIERAAAHGADELELIGDSQLVVRQVEGRYKVKHADMKELHAEVKKALAGFDSWEIRHVRRGENADADRLVNEALDGVLDG